MTTAIGPCPIVFLIVRVVTWLLLCCLVNLVVSLLQSIATLQGTLVIRPYILRRNGALVGRNGGIRLELGCLLVKQVASYLWATWNMLGL